MFVRYEDLCLNPQKTASNLLTFLNLRPHEAIDKFINKHAYSDITLESWDNYATIRNSSYMAFEWRKHLSDNYISDIQQLCGSSMSLLGYNPMMNIVSDKLDEHYPLLAKSKLN